MSWIVKLAVAVDGGLYVAGIGVVWDIGCNGISHRPFRVRCPARIVLHEVGSVMVTVSALKFAW